MSPRMPAPVLDFEPQAYVRAVATSRVGFVVIAENAEILPLVAEKGDVINSKASVALLIQCRVFAFALVCPRKKRIISRLASGARRAADAAAGPSMARTMQDPLLKDLPAGRVETMRV